MLTPTFRLAAPLAALVLAGCATLSQPTASADPSLSVPPKTSLRGYLAAGVIDGAALLGPPPAVDSPAGRADRAAFEATRAEAGSARWITAQQDNDLWNGGAVKRLACALGRDISEARTPRTLNLLHRVELDVRTVGGPAKDFYKRVRPPIGNDAPICIPREPWLATNGSYPSGHSATGWGWALILAETQPGRATEILAVGKEMGDSRVICGVHFPSDIDAGRTVAAAMVSRLHAEPAFTADLEATKRELAAAPPATGC